MQTNVLDAASLSIVRELQADGLLSVQQLAERVGLSTTPVWRRLRALQSDGVIRRHVALMDREKLGLAICVLAYVTLSGHREGVIESFERQVHSWPEVMECSSITGDADFVLKVVVADMKAYDRFLTERVFKLPGVANVRSNVVLREVKYETALPVG